MTIYKMPPYSKLFRQAATNFHVTINTFPFLNIQTLWHKDWDNVNYFLSTNSLSICMSYIALSTIRFLDFVQHLVLKKVTQCFENWIYCNLTWKGGEACTQLYLMEEAILNHWTTMPVNYLYTCDEV